MNGTDSWEADPEVRTMRRIFGHMEKTQASLLASLGVDPDDDRLRGWRERALPRFERCWRVAARKRLKLTEQRAALLYLHCLSAEMGREGVRVTSDVLQPDGEIETIVKESGG